MAVARAARSCPVLHCASICILTVTGILDSFTSYILGEHMMFNENYIVGLGASLCGYVIQQSNTAQCITPARPANTHCLS